MADEKFDKISKTAADYENPAHGDDKCQGCKHFESATRHCELVKGIIAPGAWCQLYSPKK